MSLTSQSPRNVRRMQTLVKDRLITFLPYSHTTNRYEIDQSTTIHTDPKEVPEKTPRVVEAAVRYMLNCTASNNHHISNDSLKQVEMPTQKHLLSSTLTIFRKTNTHTVE